MNMHGLTSYDLNKSNILKRRNITNILDRHMQLLINVNSNMAASNSQDNKISLQTLFSNITQTSHTSQVMHIRIIIQSNIDSIQHNMT